MRPGRELELSIQLLDLVENDLVGAFAKLTGWSPDELVSQRLVTDEDVQWVGHARTGGRGDQTVEEDDVGREPAVSRDVAVARAGAGSPSTRRRHGGARAADPTPRGMCLPP